MWVIDMATGELLFHEQVSHGLNSDKDNDGYVDQNGGLDNTVGSGQSSIGLMKASETYYSSKFEGTAMRIDGLEQGFNDNVRRRAVVMHDAKYADNKRNQKMGRSLGCFVLDPDITGDVIKTISNGSLIFSYYPDKEWLKKSRYLNNAPMT